MNEGDIYWLVIDKHKVQTVLKMVCFVLSCIYGCQFIRSGERWRMSHVSPGEGVQGLLDGID